MKSVFRIYAKTNKSLDPYLSHEIRQMGLTPKYQDCLHAFYFNANFHDLFNLSFNSLTIENMYIQMGHKFPIHSRYIKSGRTIQQQLSQYLKKINFKGFFPIKRGIVQNITMNLLIRESKNNLPSQNALLSVLKNHLNKQIIMSQYRKMVNSADSPAQKLQNYYDIKMLVHKKWQYEDNITELSGQSLLSKSNQGNPNLISDKLVELQNSNNLELIKPENIISVNQQNNLSEFSYQPNLTLYVRKNYGRFLLKINKKNLYKHGWKQKVGWAPIRQTLTASTLYRAGFIQRIKKQKTSLKLWDPFCGSGTIPLVTCIMGSCLPIHQDHINNFVWPHWPIYKERYLAEYKYQKQMQAKQRKFQILGSDIDPKATEYSIVNLKKFIQNNPIIANDQSFLKKKPVDQIFQLSPNSIYVGCGDFQKIAPTILNNSEKKVNIFTNLPYLNTRSKQHHPLNQLTSIYKRFNQLINKYQQFLQNVFVIVDAEGMQNDNHFINFGRQKWQLLDKFDNGGIQIVLLGWKKNKDGWGQFQIQNLKQQNLNSISPYQIQKQNLLKNYRQQIKSLQGKQYKLPKYVADPSKYKRYKRIVQKRKARHLRAAYQIFAEKREKNTIYARYARKSLALRLSKRGMAWKKMNMSIIGNKLPELKQKLKKQFQQRIENALQRSEKIKQLKKNKKDRKIKKW